MNFLICDEFQDIKIKQLGLKFYDQHYQILKVMPYFVEHLKVLVTGVMNYLNKQKAIMTGKSFKYTTLEGEQVSDDEIEQAKQDLDLRTFQQEYEATFVNYSGMIYYNFSRDKNIIEKYNKNHQFLHIGFRF